MKKLLLLILLLPSVCWAQSTTTSATITDAGGQSWNNGTYVFSFRVSPLNPTAQYYWNGTPFDKNTTIAGNLDGTGHFSVSIPSNTSINPSGSTWDLEVCPIAKGNTPCYTRQSISITGGSMDLSAIVVPPAISIDLSHPAYPFVVAYTSTEITTAPIGGIFYNYTTSHYYICEAINGPQQWYGACTNWVQICQAGDTTCGGAGGGTLTNFSAGNLPPIFTTSVTNPTTTPALAFNLSNAGPFTVLGNNTSGSGPPAYFQLPQTFATVASETTSLPNSRRLIAGTNISFDISVPGQLTINGSGGGVGCTLPGVNNAVLEEHPIGTCTGSTHFTWDNTLFNFQVSNASANTVGTNNTYTIGAGNNLTGSTKVYTLGEGNLANTSSSQTYMVGTANLIGLYGTIATQFSNLGSYSIGSNTQGDTTHANSAGNGIVQVGINGVIHRSSLVTSVGSNGVGNPTGSGTQINGAIFGGNFIGNCVNQTALCGSPGSGSVNEFDIFGEGNTILKNGTGSVQSVVMGGLLNRVDTTVANVSGGSTLWGLDNELDGGAGADVQIFGASNTVHGLGTTNCLAASDSYVGGSLNVLTTISNAHVFGGGNTVTSHNCVAIFGMKITASADSTAYYGMSPTAGLTISTAGGNDNVRRSPLAFASLPACAAGTEGSFAAITDSSVNTWGTTITGGSTNHVLGYCDGTNWTVAGK